jgi:hypothetical protein
MRIAWCLSGQPRNYEQGLEYTKRNLLDHHDVDVFFHAWHDPDKVGQKFDSAPWIDDAGSYQPDVKENLLDIYKPKKHSFEKPIQFIDESNYESDFVWSPEHTNIGFSFTYSLLQANELKKKYEQENNFKYDWVFRARFDWALNHPINFDELDSNFIYIPDFEKSFETPNNPHCSDQFAFSSSKNMDVYTQLFSNIRKHWENMEIKHMGENLLLHHLLANKMEMKGFDYTHTFGGNSLLR